MDHMIFSSYGPIVKIITESRAYSFSSVLSAFSDGSVTFSEVTISGVSALSSSSS